MSANLLVKKKEDQTIDDFVSFFHLELGTCEFQERQSANYFDERYFSASVLGIRLKVSTADEEEFSEYDFRIWLDVDRVYVDDKSFLDSLADCVARKLALFGYQVIRPLDFGRSRSPAISYRLCSTDSVNPQERVITEED